MKYIINILISLAFFTWSFAMAQEQTIETVIQTGHYATVRTVAFSPDGRFAATGSADKTIKLWEASTGREIRSYLGSKGTAWKLAFSPDNSMIASIDAEYNIRIWEVQSSRIIRTLDLPGDGFVAVAFTPGGESLVTGTEKNHAILWDISSGNEIRRFKPDTADIIMQKNFGYPYARSVEISPDGKWLLTGSSDRTAFIFNFNSGRQVKKFKGDKGSCTSCYISASFSPDGQRIVIGHTDSVFIWDIASERVVRTMEGRRGSYGAAKYSYDGKYISSILYGIIHVWNAQTGKLVRTIGEEEKNYRDLQFSPVSNTMLAGNENRVAHIWKIPSGMKIMTFKGYLNDFGEEILGDSYMYWVAFINEIRLSPDGKYVAIGKTGNNARLMDFATGKLVSTFRGHKGIVISLDFSPDGKRLATGSVDGTVRIWDVENGDSVMQLPGRNSNIPYFSIDFSPDGNLLATGSWDGRVKIWDLNTGNLLQSIRAHDDASPYTVQFSQSGLYVISGGLDRKLKLFEIDTGAEIREFIGHTDVVASVRRHPDGRHLVSASWDGKVKMWDMATGLQVKRFIGHSSRVQAVDFDASGKKMVTGSDDNTAILWDVETGEVVRKFEGHKGTVSSVNISPDGEFLITGSHDGTIKSWDIKTGNELLTHIFLGESDWLVKNRDGYFDASEGAKKSIFFVRGTTIYNIDQFFEEFYKPGLLKETYQTRGQVQSDANILKRLEESPPPTVRVLSPADGDTVKSSIATVRISLTNNGGGIHEIRVLNNGKRLPVDNTELQQVRREGKFMVKNIDIELVTGENELLVSALSYGRIESEPDTVRLFYKGLERVINCYLVSIGINEYKNPALDLNYARADARAFGKTISAAAKDLFKKVELYELYDKEATRSNILSMLDELAGIAEPQDVLVFFYAGHGSMVENKFFFIPTESVTLYQLDKLNEESIYAGMIQEKLKNIPALKQVVILDACQSGASAELLAQRGASEEKALAQLSRGSGVHVMAAAGSEQFATEVGSLGHGLFTYTILEALAGQADGAPKDGNVTIYELKAYLNDQVPELSKKYKGSTQWPYTFSIGHDFPIVREDN
jgi:WD40 repeat protein